ncbi:MAG: hypothetical protein QOD99_1511 [Chthoniobacter sp.]|jgi:UPF0176 protein|nr:hypothetical protein [Chthoniobacter sp.]
MAAFTNIAGYRFVSLHELQPLRERLLALCGANELRGTILLATEGINLCVSGTPSAVAVLLAELRAVQGLEDFEVKESVSAERPFSRMLVKIKKEIIALGVKGLDPSRRPTTKVSARTLKQWLDSDHPVTLLDARNDYEVRMGTFRTAVPAGIETFRDFPDAVRRLPAELKEQPIVMFCTGGIRCEKAGPLMEREGFQHVFQLDGGILKYFEECGGAHFQGECFVFDRRVGVDAELRETNSVMCFQCQMPLTTDEQRHPHYVREQTCPYCFPSR